MGVGFGVREGVLGVLEGGQCARLAMEGLGNLKIAG